MSRKMKESGIDWIGSIPKSWNTIKFKYLHGGMNTGEGIDKNFWSNEPTDKLFYTAGIKPIRTNYEDFPEWKYTKENDLLLARNGTPYIYIPYPNACYTDHIIRATMNASVNKRFVQYGLQCSIASVVVDSVSLATWSASLWNKQVIAWPSAEEQERIVPFLDEKCAEIDNVLEKTRASINEYKKLKQSIITQAVTKGIRGDRAMKDSGIEWIGEIPEDWDAKRGKALFHEIKNLSTDGTEELLTVSQYTGITPRSQKNVTMFQSESLVGYKIVEIGDIGANTMWLWDGAIGVSTYRGVISPSYNVYRQNNGEYDSRYLDYLLRNPLLVQHYESKSTGIRASRLRLYPQQFLSIMFPLPDIIEQRVIAEYLDNKCKGIETLIGKKYELIADLEGYKNSLIYEYVTGKKEVPQA